MTEFHVSCDDAGFWGQNISDKAFGFFSELSIIVFNCRLTTDSVENDFKMARQGDLKVLYENASKGWLGDSV